MVRFVSSLLAIFIVLLAWTPPAAAYVGPGLGLGAIGAILGVLLSVLLAVIAIFWYPLKRWLGIGKKKVKSKSDQDSNTKQ